MPAAGLFKTEPREGDQGRFSNGRPAQPPRRVRNGAPQSCAPREMASHCCCRNYAQGTRARRALVGHRHRHHPPCIVGQRCVLPSQHQHSGHCARGNEQVPPMCARGQARLELYPKGGHAACTRTGRYLRSRVGRSFPTGRVDWAIGARHTPFF